MTSSDATPAPQETPFDDNAGATTPDALTADVDGSTAASQLSQPSHAANEGPREPQQRPQRRGDRRGRRPQNDVRTAGEAPSRPAAHAKPGPRPQRTVHPLLEKLAALYPQLFGARFLPLQRGVYEELLARHPQELPADELKVALGLHARSGRYLEAIASRLPRHGLDGQVVEPMAPEHVHHAIVELYRRRQARAPQEDLRPKLIARLVEAIDASGLDRATYTERVHVSRPEALALIDEAFAAHGQRVARREALQRAFEASGQATVDDFAAMYGMDPAETKRLLAG